MTDPERRPNPSLPERTTASGPLEEKGIDLAQAAIDTVGGFLGSSGGVVAGAWINSKLNPPPRDPPPDPPQVILPPNIDRD